MKIHLNEERRFWLAMTAGGILVLIMLFAWMIPNRNAVKQLKTTLCAHIGNYFGFFSLPTLTDL